MKGLLLSFPFIDLRLFPGSPVGRDPMPQAGPGSVRPIADIGAEADDRVERRLRLVELRRVSAGFEDEARHGGGRAGLDGADLLHGSILVVRALNDERGNAPAIDRILDVPGPEAGIEPGVVPAAEGDVDMGVIFGELRPQVVRLISAPRLCDRGEAYGFGEEMRRDQDEALDPLVGRFASGDRRDRGAVAVAEQNSAL